jgi:hypothetical protein
MPPVRILHLIIDEKFFDFIFKVFQEVDDVENRYVALVASKAEQFNHISRIPLWRVAGLDYAESTQATEDLAWCDVLLIHWWHNASAHVVAKVPDSVIVVWSGWGGDYYDLLPGGEVALYGEKTKELLQQISAPREGEMRSAFRYMKDALKSVFSSSKRHDVVDKSSLIKRVDYFSAPIPEDYQLLKSALGQQFRAEYAQLNYGSVEGVFVRGGCGAGGGDILLGNSATATNNHLEMLEKLSLIDLGNRKVLAPLSYGSPEYGDEIEKHGRRLLGRNFFPIRNYMPLDEYNQLITSCSIVIMNHRRQQALGNIGAMLCRGAKVFLDEDNVVYQFFKRKGAYVFSVNEIVERGIEAFASLSDSEKKRNIEVINEVWGHDIVIENARVFVDRMRRRVASHE